MAQSAKQMNAHATDLSCLSYILSFFLSFFLLLLLHDNYFFMIIKLTDFAVLCDDLWTSLHGQSVKIFT